MPPLDTALSDEELDSPPSSPERFRTKSILKIPKVTIAASAFGSLLKVKRSKKKNKSNKRVSFSEDTRSPSPSYQTETSSVILNHPSKNTGFSLACLQAALEESQQLYGDKHANTAIAYNNLGNWYFRKGDWEIACHAYQHAAYTCYAGPHTADALANLGAVYWTTGELSRAQVALQQSLDVYAHVCDHHSNQTLLLVANVYHQLGLVHSLQRDFVHSLAALHQAMSIREQIGRPELVTKTMEAMGHVCLLARDYDTAIAWYSHALARSPSTSKTGLPTRKKLAWVYCQVKDWTAALAVLYHVLHEQRQACAQTLHLTSSSLSFSPDTQRQHQLHVQRRQAALEMGQTLQTMQTVYLKLGQTRNSELCHDELLYLMQHESIQQHEVDRAVSLLERSLNF